MTGDAGRFRTVVDAIDEWTPRESAEETTRLSNLRDRLQRAVEEAEVRRDDAVADLAVSDDVAVEFEDGVDAATVDRLADRVDDRRESYPYVVVCATAVEDVEDWQALKDRYGGRQREGLGIGERNTEIVFVEKSVDDR